MTKYLIVFWRDIPVQVKVRDGKERSSRPLTPRFEKAVHRAAYRAKAIHGEAYMREWRTSPWSERDGAAEVVLTAVAADLEAAYSDERLDKLARSKGYETDDG